MHIETSKKKIIVLYEFLKIHITIRAVVHIFTPLHI
jgi:hypothetical protein